MTAIDFFQAVQDWGEKDICTKGVSNSQNEGEGRGGAIGIIEQPDKTPALQAKLKQVKFSIKLYIINSVSSSLFNI